MSAPQKRARIATMTEPDPETVKRSIIIGAYQARESLSLAERVAEQSDISPSDLSHAQSHILDAQTHLGAALSHLRILPLIDRSTYLDIDGAVTLIRRAIATAKAALAHGEVAASYEPPSLGVSDFDLKMEHRARRHWFKATQTARQEAHRALAELAELLPDSYETEEL